MVPDVTNSPRTIEQTDELNMTENLTQSSRQETKARRGSLHIALTQWRSGYGLSRYYSLFTGVVCDAGNCVTMLEWNFRPTCGSGGTHSAQCHPQATPVDSESHERHSGDWPAHQSQFKMSSGNFLTIESGDFPTVLRPGAAEGETTPQRPAYQVYPAI